MLQPVLLLSGLALCALLYPVLKRTTITGLLVLAFLPVVSFLLARSGKIVISNGEFPLFTLLVAIVLYAHRSNIASEFGATFTKGDS